MNNEELQQQVQKEAYKQYREFLIMEYDDYGTTFYYLFSIFKIMEFLIYHADEKTQKAFVKGDFDLMDINTNVNNDFEVLDENDIDIIKDEINNIIK